MSGHPLALASIRRDGGTQPRAAINDQAVSDYKEGMTHGAEFPPVDVFYDGSDYWLADGFHRVEAAHRAGFNEIACEMHQGTRQDAQWYSFGANKSNGLRRTNRDKQRAVKAALLHPSAAELSDGQIAVHVGVSDQMVRNYRRKAASTSNGLKSSRRTGRDGRSLNVARIGKSSAANTVSSPLPAASDKALGEVPAGARSADSSAEAELSTPRRRTSRSQRIDGLARLTLSILEDAKHLACLATWLGETAGAFDEAELLLANAITAIDTAIAEIEQKAIAADPLNAFRLGIQEGKS